MPKVTVKGVVYDVDLPPDWTFEEELEVRRLTNLWPGDVWRSPLPIAAGMCAIVAYHRAGLPAEEILQLKESERTLDLSDLAGDADPPADGAEEAPAEEGH